MAMCNSVDSFSCCKFTADATHPKIASATQPTTQTLLRTYFANHFESSSHARIATQTQQHDKQHRRTIESVKRGHKQPHEQSENTSSHTNALSGAGHKIFEKQNGGRGLRLRPLGARIRSSRKIRNQMHKRTCRHAHAQTKVKTATSSHSQTVSFAVRFVIRQLVVNDDQWRALGVPVLTTTENNTLIRFVHQHQMRATTQAAPTAPPRVTDLCRQTAFKCDELADVAQFRLRAHEVDAHAVEQRRWCAVCLDIRVPNKGNRKNQRTKKIQRQPYVPMVFYSFSTRSRPAER